MLIKELDDRQPDLEALEALLARSDVDVVTRQRIEFEIRTIRSGVKAERDASAA